MLKTKRTDRWHWLIVKHITSKMDVFTTYLCRRTRLLLPTYSLERCAQ
jgi:hypothetical protein